MSDELRKALAFNVRNLRQTRGMSQHDLALAAGVELKAIDTIETVGRNVTLDTLGQLAAALDVPPSDLLITGKPFW